MQQQQNCRLPSFLTFLRYFYTYHVCSAWTLWLLTLKNNQHKVADLGQRLYLRDSALPLILRKVSTYIDKWVLVRLLKKSKQQKSGNIIFIDSNRREYRCDIMIDVVEQFNWGFSSWRTPKVNLVGDLNSSLRGERVLSLPEASTAPSPWTAASVMRLSSMCQSTYMLGTVWPAHWLWQALRDFGCKGTFGRAMFKLVRICHFGEGWPKLCTHTCI